MKRRHRRLGLAITSLALAASYLAYNAQGETSAIVHFDIEANPRTVDEGELVEFDILNTDFIDPETGETLLVPPVIGEIVWDFDDGSQGDRSADFRTSHRFADNQVGPYEVSARLLSSRNWVKVKVDNVAPEIHDILRTRPALEQEPVEFKALARDPGVNDILTYTWDFGDGGTATGQHVEHTYSEKGTYSVTVTVDDGDAGSDTETIQVPIGNVGWFQVSGQIPLPRTEIENVILVGSTPNPFDRKPTDPCQIRFQMHGANPEKGLGFTLTASLTPGLGQRSYRVGSTTEWDGMHRDDAANSGVFFGDFSPPNDRARRNFGGTVVGGPFWSRSGSVHVDYFDGDYFELRFSVDLVENIPAFYDPRRVHVEGVLAQTIRKAREDSPLSMLGNVAKAKIYLCGRDEGNFDIAKRKPSAEAINVDYLNPKIEVSFTEPVDPRSIQNNFSLEFRGASNFEKVQGSWRPVPGDPKSVQFVPQARLHESTIHCLRVDTEDRGVRGKEGEMLESALDTAFSDETRPACETQSEEFGQREWAFSTRPEFTSSKVDVYQASVAGDGTPLVPGKPTVSRVYTTWTNPDVDETAKVKSIPARVTVLAHNDSPVYAPRPRATIRRPSQFTPEDMKNAENSINFYNWLPVGSGRMSLKPVIEPLDEDDTPVSEFEGSVTELERGDRSQSLTFDYHFVEVEVDYQRVCQQHHEPGCRQGCDGFEGEGGVEACVNVCLFNKVPACVAGLESRYGPEAGLQKEFSPADLTEGHRLAHEGARFTTQNFPVVETVARGGQPLRVVLPLLPGLHLHVQVASGLFRAGEDSDSDVLVGFVQPGLLPRATGMMIPFPTPGKRVLLLEVGQASAATFAHEVGHFYQLDHCPDRPEFNRPCPLPQIQGFRVSPSGESGFNKHKLEGNQEASNLDPLMAWALPPPEQVFIKKADYKRLFDTIANAPPRPQAWMAPGLQPSHQSSLLAALLLPGPAFAQSGPARVPILVVSGLVEAGEIRLNRVRESLAGRAEPEPEAGPLTLELLDRSGGVLRTIPFAVLPPDPWHGDPDNPPYFQLAVPPVSGLAAVRVRGPEGSEATRVRSPSPPVVEAEATTESNGGRSLRWSSQDADGDQVLADVFLRADNKGPWRGAAIDTSVGELTIEARELPAGERVTARIVVSDGFNTAATEVDLGPGAPISVLTVIPADGATEVPQSLDVTAWVSNPMVEGDKRIVPMPAGTFRLNDPEGQEVFADVAYQPRAGVITLTPVEPLRPGTRYSATLEDLEDVWGNRLPAPVTWSFVTRDSQRAETTH